MNRRTILYAKVICIAALAASAGYAFVRLFLLGQRADISILLVNVVLFTAIAGVLIYVLKKERDLQREKLFRD
ncbi:MAG TPA: hypothetical protein VIB07_03800 [Nitrososphaera sp.]